MYVVTFYSFKGGVGRSMALANVALDLVKRGKRVLMVDFDLEAPGLNTFNFGIKDSSKGGVVEFVKSYIENNKSPKVKDYVSSCEENSKRQGKLWLMPAGRIDDNYPSALSTIDWQDLYRNRSGYLLFEDLKAQWLQEFSPDYVLVDSRTGHSDVSGICTRQLPNSVVFLFFPNEQNLLGLRKVVSSVDEENGLRVGPNEEIVKHYVTSNVPDLDDEDSILADRLVNFSKDLKYPELTATIHRYDSMALLNQVIFTEERPNTRLAQEYRILVNKIVFNNLEDRDGAVSFIQGLVDNNYPSKESGANDTAVREKLHAISGKHSKDAEILNLMSIIQERSGDYGDAISSMDRAVSVASSTGTFPVLRRAKLLFYSGKIASSLNEVTNALEMTELGFADVRLALNLLRRIDARQLPRAVHSQSVLNLGASEFSAIMHTHVLVEESRKELSEKLLEAYIAEHKIDLELDRDLEKYTSLRMLMALIKIGLSKGEEAMPVISPKRPTIKNNLFTIFNYGMAEWSVRGELPRDLFAMGLKRLSDYDFSKIDPIMKQCISFCYWASGDQMKAKTILDLARNDALEISQTAFSYWSYLYLEVDGFLSDIELMKKFYDGKGRPPSFIMEEKH